MKSTWAPLYQEDPLPPLLRVRHRLPHSGTCTPPTHNKLPTTTVPTCVTDTRVPQKLFGVGPTVSVCEAGHCVGGLPFPIRVYKFGAPRRPGPNRGGGEARRRLCSGLARWSPGRIREESEDIDRSRPAAGDGMLVGPGRAAGAAGLARRRRPLRGSSDRAVEAAAGGEHVRVRGRARDVGDAEPHQHGGGQAGAAAGQEAQPVPAAAAVDREPLPLRGLLEGLRGRPFPLWLA